MSNIAILTDEQGNFIGQKDRHALVKGDMIAISVLWLTNSRGEILLAQRSTDKKIDPGLWGPSAAGTLEPGETFETNSIKEAEEEIGLRGVHPRELTRFHFWRTDNGTGRYVIWYHALSDKPAQDFVLQTEEVSAVRWISPDNLLREVETSPESFVFPLQRLQQLIDLLG